MKKILSFVFRKTHVSVFLIIFGVIAFGLYFNARKCMQSQVLTSRTHDLMTHIAETQAKMFETDAVFMRYSISKEPRYLELYKQNNSDTESTRTRLKLLIHENLTQQENWEELNKSAIASQLLKSSVINGDIPVLHKAVVSTENNNLHNNISTRLRMMMDEEKRLLEIRQDEFNESVGMLVVLIALIITFLGIAFGFIVGEANAQKNILSNFINGVQA